MLPGDVGGRRTDPNISREFENMPTDEELKKDIDKAHGNLEATAEIFQSHYAHLKSTGDYKGYALMVAGWVIGIVMGIYI